MSAVEKPSAAINFVINVLRLDVKLRVKLRSAQALIYERADDEQGMNIFQLARPANDRLLHLQLQFQRMQFGRASEKLAAHGALAAHYRRDGRRFIATAIDILGNKIATQ